MYLEIIYTVSSCIWIENPPGVARRACGDSIAGSTIRRLNRVFVRFGTQSIDRSENPRLPDEAADQSALTRKVHQAQADCQRQQALTG